MGIFRVIVGNIGTVYDGNNYMIACKHYGEYKRQSKTNYGRAGGESVTLWHHDEIKLEYIGSLERSMSDDT